MVTRYTEENKTLELWKEEAERNQNSRHYYYEMAMKHARMNHEKDRRIAELEKERDAWKAAAYSNGTSLDRAIKQLGVKTYGDK